MTDTDTLITGNVSLPNSGIGKIIKLSVVLSAVISLSVYVGYLFAGNRSIKTAFYGISDFNGFISVITPTLVLFAVLLVTSFAPFFIPTLSAVMWIRGMSIGIMSSVLADGDIAGICIFASYITATVMMMIFGITAVYNKSHGKKTYQTFLVTSGISVLAFAAMAAFRIIFT